MGFGGHTSKRERETDPNWCIPRKLCMKNYFKQSASNK